MDQPPVGGHPEGAGPVHVEASLREGLQGEGGRDLLEGHGVSLGDALPEALGSPEVDPAPAPAGDAGDEGAWPQVAAEGAAAAGFVPVQPGPRSDPHLFLGRGGPEGAGLSPGPPPGAYEDPAIRGQEGAFRRGHPDPAILPRGQVHDVTAWKSRGGRQGLEPPLDAPQEAPRQGADPEGPVRSDQERRDETGREPLHGSEGIEGDPIEAEEAALGPQPEESRLVLGEALHHQVVQARFLIITLEQPPGWRQGTGGWGASRPRNPPQKKAEGQDQDFARWREHGGNRVGAIYRAVPPGT
jgi:hypothetical protein